LDEEKMAKSKAQKIQMKEEFTLSFNNAAAAIAADYQGTTTEDLTALRRKLKEIGCGLKVVKNRVAIKAIEDSCDSYEELKKYFQGAIAVVYLGEDVAAGAKELLAFAKGQKNFEIKGGVLDAGDLSVANIKAISDLPSKDVLIAKILGSIVAPHKNLLYVLNGVSTNLVRAISAIRDKKSD